MSDLHHSRAIVGARTRAGQRGQSAATKTIEPSPINWKLKGTFDWVDIGSLEVPVDQYQRDRSFSKRASEIALNWNWVAVGTLIVIMRKGALKVADGGTRLAAAKKRGGIKELPCMLHEVGTEQEEAEAYRLINDHRDKLKVHELHHAEIFEGRDLALDTEAYLDKLRSHAVEFDSLAELRRKLARRYRAHTWRLIPIFTEIASGRRLSSRVFKGMVMTEARLSGSQETLTAKPYSALLKKHGVLGLETAISALVPPRTGGGSSSLFVRAICNLLRINLKGLDT